ncbi:DNA-directed RNA polymerase subunit omega [Calothrix sp. NIES-2100]|uniref:DNA-directed RNA polymerase subunit omega n=1 Tax=Calothrix sp. NIES-2100 TaxID=1954172 RepID=UPI0030D86B39
MANKSKESARLADVKQRLADNCEQQRLMALEEALTLGQEGFDLFTQQALQDQSEKIRQSAYWILHQYNPYLRKNSQEANSSKRIFPTDTIACVAISHNNQILVGGSWQKIWVWNLQTGELLRTIDGHSHWVLSVAISPDGNTLVSGSADKTVKFWNLKTGLLIRQINAHSNWVSAVAITPDGKTLVTASADKTIKIWNFDTNQLQRTLLKHSGSVLSLAISSDGKVIASGSTDNSVKLWNLQSGELYRSLEQHLDWVQAVSLSKDSKLLISGSRDGSIKFWQADSEDENESQSSNLENSSLISRFTAGAVYWIGAPFFGLGKLVGKGNNKLKLNINNLECSSTLHQDFLSSVNNIIISTESNIIISVTDDNTIKLWNIETKQLVRNWIGHSSFVNSAAISSDGKILATASNNWIKLWNLHTGQLLHSLKGCSEPRLTSLSIFPSQLQMECGQSQTFSIKGLDQYSQEITVEKFLWQAKGGNIDQNGLFIAGEKEGKFTVIATTGMFHISASVTIIEPPKLTKLVIIPQQTNLECGKTQTFKIRGFDQRGSEITVEKVLWQATGGAIDADGIFHAGQNPGAFTITANVEAVKASTLVTLIEPPKLQKLIISPLQPTLDFGQSLHFTVQGVDQYGNNINIKEISWRATGGTISPDGRLGASYQEQKITVTASVGDISSSTTLNFIEPAKLTTLVISPEQIEMKPREHQRFSVRGLDQRGNAIATGKIAWSATGGTIDQDGNFIVTDNAKGDFSISAKAIEHNISATAKVAIPVVLQRLEVFPNNLQIEPDQIQTFTVIGFDQGGDEIPIIRVDWQCTSGGQINDDGTFIGSYETDIVHITASVGNLSDVACVRLLPVLTSLEIEPHRMQIKPNERLNLKVRGFDQFRNEVKIKNIRWQTTEGKIYPDGTFVAVDKNANITVTASLGNIVGTASFKVIEPSRLTQLMISPEQIVMSPETFQHFELIGLDQRGNAIAISGINWKATGGNIEQNGDYFTDRNQKGQFTITATVGKLSVSAHVIVPSVLKRLDIFPPQIQLEPEATQTFTAVGFDQQNAEIALEIVDWKSSQGGSISRQGLFQGGYSHRKVTVTASVGNIHKSADVTLLPILRKLQISPLAVQLKPNESQIFSVIGFDQYGEKIDPGEILWEASGGEIDQNGNFIADFNAKGQFWVTATSRLTYKFNKQTRILLVNVGISIRLLSYLLRVLAQVQDEYTSEQNTEDVSEVSATSTLIDNFEVSLQAWIHKSINKLIFRTLLFISKLSFKQARAYVSTSAEVTVLPVLRYLEISPAKVQLKPYEKINFKVIGLDQHYHEIQVSNVVWKATGGNISSNGTLSVDDKYKNITITATVGIISKSANVTVLDLPKIIQPIIGNNPGTIANNPETIANNPETIANNPETIANNPGTIANNPETIANNPETIANNPGANSGYFKISKYTNISDCYDDKQILQISEALLQNSPNRYRLVLLVARRARQILKNHLYEDMTLKEAVIQAIEEIYRELSQLEV